jgi:hypothetical protein
MRLICPPLAKLEEALILVVVMLPVALRVIAPPSPPRKILEELRSLAVILPLVAVSVIAPLLAGSIKLETAA